MEQGKSQRKMNLEDFELIADEIREERDRETEALIDFLRKKILPN